MDRIVEVAQTLVGSGRTCIEVRWNINIQSLTRSDIVKALDEFVEASLLLQEVV